MKKLITTVAFSLGALVLGCQETREAGSELEQGAEHLGQEVEEGARDLGQEVEQRERALERQPGAERDLAQQPNEIPALKQRHQVMQQKYDELSRRVQAGTPEDEIKNKMDAIRIKLDEAKVRFESMPQLQGEQQREATDEIKDKLDDVQDEIDEVARDFEG